MRGECRISLRVELSHSPSPSTSFRFGALTMFLGDCIQGDLVSPSDGMLISPFCFGRLVRSETILDETIERNKGPNTTNDKRKRGRGKAKRK